MLDLIFLIAFALSPSTGPDRYDAIILSAATDHGVDPAVLKGLLIVESGMRADPPGRAGRGVAQLTPAGVAWVNQLRSRKVAPLEPLDNQPDGLRGDAVGVCDLLERHRTISIDRSDLDHLPRCQFGAAMTLSTREAIRVDDCPISSPAGQESETRSVAHVLSRSNPFKILAAVVVLHAVLVINLVAQRPRTNEGERHRVMDSHRPSPGSPARPLGVEADDRVAVDIRPALQRPSVLRSPDVATVHDFIVTESRDFSPSHRVVLHRVVDASKLTMMDAVNPVLAIPAAAELLAYSTRRWGSVEAGVSAYRCPSHAGLVRRLGIDAAERSGKMDHCGHVRMGTGYVRKVLRAAAKIRLGQNSYRKNMRSGTEKAVDSIGRLLQVR